MPGRWRPRLENFAAYHSASAQPWEQQALTRARVIAGDPALAERVEAGIWANLARPREPRALGRAIRAMRTRIFKEHGSARAWNLKHAPGGIVETEFAVQYLKLVHAHDCPRLRATDMREILAAVAEAGLLPVDQVEALRRAHALHQALQAVLRLSASDRFDPATAPPRQLESLTRAAALALEGEPPPEDFATLERRLVESQAAVRQIFDEWCPVGLRAPQAEQGNDADE